jgi:hypothetical protein
VSGQADSRLIHFLQPVQEHRPILLGKHVRANVDPIVRRDSENSHVECAMMNAAQGKSVGYLRQTALVAVSDDMGRIKQLGPLKSADGATLRIRCYDEFAEAPLM